MILQAIKAWSAGKIIPILMIVGGLLIASSATLFVLYKLKSKDLVISNQQVVTVTEKLTTVKAELAGLETQLAEERIRHANLETELRKNYNDYVQKQADLEKKKKDAARKDSAKKNPKVYEIESQKINDEYMNRMNCISGNSVSCSKL